MPLTLRSLQAITNAPEVYDYAWMRTLIDNIAVDQKGRSCRLVENDDQWHFEQQLLRYHSGLHLVITEQEQLDGFLRRGWLKLSDNPIVIHRIHWRSDELTVVCSDKVSSWFTMAAG